MPASAVPEPGAQSSLPLRRRGMSVPTRIGLMVVLVIVFTVSLVSFLNYSNYRKNYAELTRSRYLVLANDIKETIEYSLNLGLPLGQLSQVQQLLDEVKARESDVLFVQVFSDQGNTAFSTDRALLGKKVEQAWLDKLRRVRNGGHWQDANETAYLVATPIINNFDVKSGAVLIGYSKSQFDNKLAAMRDLLSGDTLAIFVLVLVLTVGGVYLIMRKLDANIAHVEHSLNDFIAHPNIRPPLDRHLDPELQRDILEFEEVSRNALAQIEAAEQALAAIEAEGKRA